MIKFWILSLNFLFSVAVSQNSANCSGTSVQIKLVSLPNYIFYYRVNQDCPNVSLVDHCKLFNCLKQNGEVCYRYEVFQEYNHTVCLEKCCLGIAKVNKKLFDDLECNSFDFLGKRELQQKDLAQNQPNPNTENSTNSSNSQEYSSNTPTNTQQPNNFKAAILASSLTLVLITGLLLCFCRFKEIRRSQRNNPQNTPQQQIDSQRALSPSKSAQKIKQKHWCLPQSTQDAKEVKLLSQQCAICLNDRPNCTFDCTHGFHKACIFQWLQRTLRCPLCKSQKIYGLTIRCEKCLIYRYSCSLGNLKSSFVTQDFCYSCFASVN